MSNLLILNINNLKNISKLGIIKILIIIFMSIYLLGNFSPFYEGYDSYIYGVLATLIVNGQFEYNDPAGFLKETGEWEFVPHPLVQTIHHSAIPVGGIGIYFLSAFFYLVAGYHGLFYLGPIFTILFFIVSERISTKLFGNFVGFVTLLFLSTDEAVLYFGSQLLTDIIFSTFLILGTYYLIKFLQQQKKSFILLCSIFLATSAFFRLPGMIFLPIEIFVIIGYITFQLITDIRKPFSSPISNKLRFFKNNRNLIKISSYVIIPWLIFFIFMISFNLYYFEKSFAINYTERPFPPGYKIDSILTFFKFDLDRLSWFHYYSVSLIPDTLNSFLDNLPNLYSHEYLGKIWIGFFSCMFIISAVIISVYSKQMRIPVIVFSIFITIFLLFNSGSYLHSESYNIDNYAGPISLIQTRMMIPVLGFSFILFGFIFNNFRNMNPKNISNRSARIISNFFVNLIIVLFIALIVFSILTSAPSKQIINSNFDFKNPGDYSNRYPLDLEGISEKSIIVGGRPGASIEYSSIPFFPFWEYMPTIRYEWNPDMVPQKPIETLKEKITEGYDVYVFKMFDDRRPFENQYYNYLATEHDLILKDFSNTFCKMEIRDTNKTKNSDFLEDLDANCYASLNLLIEFD